MGLVESLYKFTLYDPTLTVKVSLSIENFVYEQILGMPMPPITQYLETSQLHDNYGSKLQERIFNMQLYLSANSPTTFFQQREELIRILHPYPTLLPCTLHVELPDNSMWRIHVFCTSLIFSPYNGKQTELTKPTTPYIQLVQFTLVAPNPVWYQYATPIITYFYQSDIPSAKNIAYRGSWLAYPYPFSIRGPIAHPVITNVSGGFNIDLNYTIPNNRTVLIDLRDNYKTVTLGSTSLLSYLLPAPHLDTFAFLPAPEALNGINTIRVEGVGLGTNTRVAMSITPTRLCI